MGRRSLRHLLERTRLQASAAAWSLAALVLLSGSAAALGASPWIVVVFAALQVVVVLAALLRPHGDGAWALGAFVFAVVLALFLLLVPAFSDATDLQRAGGPFSPEPASTQDPKDPGNQVSIEAEGGDGAR